MTEDLEARNALWMAICEAGSKLTNRCSVFISPTPEEGARIGIEMHIPEVQTWKLVEALSLLTILIWADEVHTGEVCNLFGRTGPIHFVEDGRDRYLWAQVLLTGADSALGGRPDLIITSSPDVLSETTVLRVIECKCRKNLGASDIRAEFGKAHDLRVASYHIWSFATPAARVVEGAKRLGLDLTALGFDTGWRSDLIANPEYLVNHVGNSLASSRKGMRFAQTLLESGQEIGRKLVDPIS